jgi:hypothetical protein
MARRGRLQATPRLPHERDQTPNVSDPQVERKRGSRAWIRQAARDIERGLVDTERRGVPNDVPAPRRTVKKAAPRPTLRNKGSKK